MMTPSDKLKSLPVAATHLKPSTFEQFDAHACAISDNEAAERLQSTRHKLFAIIYERSKAG